MTKQIKIRIYPNGKIESKTVGIKGKNCMKYIKEIEDLTEAKTFKSEFTNEYYENETVQNIIYNKEYQQNGNTN